MMSRARSVRRGRLLLISVLAVLVAAGGVYLYFYIRDTITNEDSAEGYRAIIASDWEEIGEGGSSLASTLSRLNTVEGLEEVAAGAANMEGAVAAAMQRNEEEGPVEGMEREDALEEKALRSLSLYLDELATVNTVGRENWAGLLTSLENAGYAAGRDVESFLAEVDYIEVSVPDAVFRASDDLKSVTPPQEGSREDGGPGESTSEDGEAVEAALEEFLSADITGYDPEKLWSLLSSGRKEIEARERGLSKEYFYQAWPEAWGGQQPYEYEIDPDTIEVSGDTANALVTVKVMTSQEPLREWVRLVREPDGWKIDTYPFVGWR